MKKGSLFNYESLVHATAAVAGSTFALTTFYPLDMVKFRVQLQDKDLSEKTTLQAIFHILKNEGITALYRGLRPTVTTMGVSNFVYFYTFHGMKGFVPEEMVNSRTDFVLSIIAGVANVLLTNPLWVANNRLKNKEEVPFTGLLDGMVHIASVEGIPALWKGVFPSLMLVANPAIHFTVYEALKRRVKVNSATGVFLLSAVSKSVATLLTYPLQLAQTRQRLMKKRLGTAALLMTILKKQGAKGLYQGMESKLLQTVLATALMFVMYEKIVQFVFKLLLGTAKRKALKG
ncbi:unnamed protein product [Callosobruchus maculatus]|uniref:Peroxisomal membrane protein PMP34 n=1 Tax=Callosobruchus maculatus TaxID=64391 RepID=A0A653CTB5_CALMS|nr:unnamed protein product [Callosobruchus maculatus]